MQRSTDCLICTSMAVAAGEKIYQESLLVPVFVLKLGNYPLNHVTSRSTLNYAPVLYLRVSEGSQCRTNTTAEMYQFRKTAGFTVLGRSLLQTAAKPFHQVLLAPLIIKTT